MCSSRLVLGLLLTLFCSPWAAALADDAPALDHDPHLQGLWRRGASSGGIIADASPHGRNAAVKGALSLEGEVDGDRPGAIAFRGDGHLEVTGYRGVSGTRPRTLAAWIKTDKPSGEILSWGSQDAGRMWTFGFIRGRLGVMPKGGYYYMNDETHDDVWHHVAVVVREAEEPNLHDDVTLYLDGEPAAIHGIGLLDLWPIDTGADLDVRIGRRFNGFLDDIRIFDRPLSDEEIQHLHRTAPAQPTNS